MFQYICVFFLLTILSGCGIVPVWVSVAYTGADVALHKQTGKTSGEHFLSGTTGRDCKFVRILEWNKICMTSREYEDYLLSLNCDTYTWDRDILGRVTCM
jgi:hypothetical protein